MRVRNGQQDYFSYGADRQVGDLEILCAMYVETSVDDTTLLPRLHGCDRAEVRLVTLKVDQKIKLAASTQAVPGCLHMISDPIIDGLVVFLGILDILMDLRRIVRLAWFVPGTHVNADSEAIG